MLYVFFWVIPRRGITQKKTYNPLKLLAENMQINGWLCKSWVFAENADPAFPAEPCMGFHKGSVRWGGE
jgi:hypothetical protein